MIPSENKSNTIALEAGFLAPSSIAVKIQTTVIFNLFKLFSFSNYI